MKNSFTAEQLNLFVTAHGRDLADAIASNDPAAFAARIPSTWLDLVAQPDASTIHAIWEPAAAHLPRFIDYLSRSDVYECLQITVVNDQMVTCMTRPPGQVPWNDFLVRRFRRTHQLSSAVRTRLDDKLADWTFADWAP
jgi:hypothetical protein